MKMEGSEHGKLEPASLFVLSSGEPITPATITFIEVPDYDYSGSGDISISGSSDYFIGISKQLESSWSILGEFDSGFDSYWNIGDGEYYWYRVEGSCGELRCDTAGVAQYDCNNMTFMTIVGARNISELCQNLANPIINPKVDFKLSSIKKYSRPIARSDSDFCNTLEDQEFCQVAECLDYCIDQDIVEEISFSMRAIESTLIYEMSGGVRLFGQVQTNKNKYYEPEFPTIAFYGSSESKIIIFGATESSFLTLSGESEVKSSSYDFTGSGFLTMGGFARTVSPSRKYQEMTGDLILYGESKVLYSPRSIGGIEISGDVEFFKFMNFNSSGKVELSGRLIDYTSPTFRTSGSGSIIFEGSSLYNFSHHGTENFNFGFRMGSFDFNSEISDPLYDSRLTISDQSINPICGCGPIALSLDLNHNLSNSSQISNFMKRSGLQIDSKFPLRYVSSDSSWRFNKSFLGRGRDGVSLEEFNILLSLSCSENSWKFSLSANLMNKSTQDELYTKFIVDIPSDIICSDNNISTTIELYTNSTNLLPISGEATNVVTPSRSSNSEFISNDVFIDGIFNQARVYYDGIGIFKNSYWSSNPLIITINKLPSDKMQDMEIYRIFS